MDKSHLNLSTSLTLAAMQPTYLPWPGFFNLIHCSDVFIFLDDAKLEKSTWHVRNKILINSKPNFLTVTLDCSRQDSIKDAKLSSETKWKDKHQKTLEMTYGKSPYGPQVLNRIIPIIANSEINYLADLNIRIILEIADMLKIKTKIHRSSELGITGKRSERLVNLCKHFGAYHYLSPIGSKEYILEDKVFEREDIPVEYQSFHSLPYKQFNSKEFIPYLSTLDLICNLGPEESYRYIIQKY